MSVNFQWADFWSVYKINPEILTPELWADMPEWLQQKSTKVQLEVLRDAPVELVTSLLWCLTMDCQIELIR